MDYIVNTPCGQVQGVAGRVPGTVAYKGIRYATAGRWEYPKQVTSWEGIYDASAYGACSYQPRSFYNEEENQTYKYLTVMYEQGGGIFWTVQFATTKADYDSLRPDLIEWAKSVNFS